MNQKKQNASRLGSKNAHIIASTIYIFYNQFIKTF